MARGGKREGAGRPAGSVTKRTREIADRALAEGKSPLEVMLDNMRHFQQVALDAEAVIEGMNEEQVHTLGQTHEEQFKALLAKVKQAAGLRLMAVECARDAAAYMHPRLSSVESKTEIVHRFVARVPSKAVNPDAWQKQNAPKIQTIQ
jgi:hypothetical protein